MKSAPLCLDCGILIGDTAKRCGPCGQKERAKHADRKDPVAREEHAREVRRGQRERRRALKNGAADSLIATQREFERRIGEAQYPGEPLHLHHIVPLSRGGGHTWGNISFVPAPLNIYIGDALPQEIYKQLRLI